MMYSPYPQWERLQREWNHETAGSDKRKEHQPAKVTNDISNFDGDLPNQTDCCVWQE